MADNIGAAAGHIDVDSVAPVSSGAAVAPSTSGVAGSVVLGPPVGSNAGGEAVEAGPPPGYVTVMQQFQVVVVGLRELGERLVNVEENQAQQQQQHQQQRQQQQ